MSKHPNNFHLNSDRRNISTLEGLPILVVDDDSDNLLLMTFILEQSGAKVMTASSAMEALEIVQKFELRLLIADISMPKVDGYSLIRKIRNLNSPHKDIPAIAVTAIATDEGQIFALISGFQSYLIKPVDPDDFVAEAIKII
ncbi:MULTISPECIES: response regulator [Nostocales]|uniref:Chemotaxis protein CheY n=3 Tax=Nostocales TaxID=1161 RepID=A0A0C1QXY5_9CYAN|nr:response regulator [Tolypothrix bouteillei VB521301]